MLAGMEAFSPTCGVATKNAEWLGRAETVRRLAEVYARAPGAAERMHTPALWRERRQTRIARAVGAERATAL